jgi:hypothetical protein
MQIKLGGMSNMAISAAMKKLSKASTGAALMSLMLSLLVAGEARLYRLTLLGLLTIALGLLLFSCHQ